MMIRLILSANLEYEIDICQKTRNGDLVVFRILDQYLQESMNWEFRSFEIKELKQLKSVSISIKGMVFSTERIYTN